VFLTISIFPTAGLQAPLNIDFLSFAQVLMVSS
jgi:hypothetical protein